MVHTSDSSSDFSIPALPLSLLPTFKSESCSTLEQPTRMHRGFGEEYKPIINNDDRFAIYLDISYFKPEELEVKIDGPFLCLEAVQESSNDVNVVKRSCNSRWIIPPDVDFPAITSTLYDGKLRINCPKLKKEPVIVRIDVLSNVTTSRQRCR